MFSNSGFILRDSLLSRWYSRRISFNMSYLEFVLSFAVNWQNNLQLWPCFEGAREAKRMQSPGSVHCLRHYLQTSSLSIVIGGKESGRKAFRVCILKRASETSREVTRRGRGSSLKGICLRKINDASDARQTLRSLNRKKQLCWHVNRCIYFSFLYVPFCLSYYVHLSVPCSLFLFPGCLFIWLVYILLFLSSSRFLTTHLHT